MYLRIKRLIDIVVSIIGLPILGILFVIFSILIKLEDRGPIFYTAERFGIDGKVFKMYKFRTMKKNSLDIRLEDGSTYNAQDDPRVTRIGKIIRKTSLDETAQFINILKGDMSLIGPRPLLADRRYDELDNTIKKILQVRPGVSGYSQAYYRNSISQQEKFENDLHYVNNVSFLLDIKIILKTMVSVFSQKNIYNENK